MIKDCVCLVLETAEEALVLARQGWLIIDADDEGFYLVKIKKG